MLPRYYLEGQEYEVGEALAKDFLVIGVAKEAVEAPPAASPPADPPADPPVKEPVPENKAMPPAPENKAKKPKAKKE